MNYSDYSKASHTRPRKHKRKETSASAEPIDSAGERIAYAAARHGSTSLLRAMLRYGMRHDGLPGLPASNLIQLCDEMGVRA